jgi:hypothetical protein
MEAPSLQGFQLEQTFFGFKPEDRVPLHENIFDMIWYAEGRWSWDDIYHMPIFLRKFYVKKMNKIFQQKIERDEEQIQERTKNAQTKHLPRKPY